MEESKHWKEAVVTDSGVELLNEWAAGRRLKVVSAYGGTGTVALDTLAAQTGLANPKQQLILLGEEDGAGGTTVQVQISNATLMAGYELNQVGVYAVLDPDTETETEPALLFLMQDREGVKIPAPTEESFMLELYCLIGITNNGRFEVSLDAAGVATTANMRKELQKAIQAHNAAADVHPSLTARAQALETALNGSPTLIQPGDPTAQTVGKKGQHYINSATGTEFECTAVTAAGCTWQAVGSAASVRDTLGAVGAMESRMADMASRVTLMELMFATKVTGNPFTVTFDSLEGLNVAGVWNTAQNRVEF